MTGWIKVHRQVMDHWIWEDAERFKWWMEIILLTNHTDKKTVIGGELITIKRGTFHTSELKLSERWGVSRNRVRRFLQLLEDDDMISTKKTTNGTTIKVHNYGVYQGKNEEEKQPMKQPTKQRAEHPTEQQTEQQEDSGRYKTKNVKKDKNVKNEKNEKKKVSTVYDFYQESGFGIINQYTAQDITYYLESFENDSDEIVTAALKLALDRNKVNWGYAKAILKDWLKSNLKSMDEVRAYEKQKMTNYKNKSNEPYILKSIEKTPQWVSDNSYKNKRSSEEERMSTEERKAFEETKKQMEKEIIEWSEEFGRTT
ncbi:DnaD domain protein [Staphylococcus sciuri]|uniref:DnaD domain protein n=1 Tax=Mammaliicoccus sciuri TaxID=1296 RepID=UPI0015D08257|nr:DnaD domain protein [Mammaliicoccus sciuri]MBF0718279.1 DnaD domain protein [Mammaliicoccus sciuri]NYS37040.1 DnaD domain protein [Mammaliicoccus sciuri]